MESYPHHYETSVDLPVPPARLFDSVDDHERLAGHMMRSSMMMGGSRMRLSADEAGGRAIGSHLRMAGRVLGFALELEEVVTERDPPRRKSWETVGEPRLLVIGGYRMGFEIMPQVGGSRLTFFIDWREPPPAWRWLGRLLGPAYAKWCTDSMASGTADWFKANPATPVTAAA